MAGRWLEGSGLFVERFFDGFGRVAFAADIDFERGAGGGEGRGQVGHGDADAEGGGDAAAAEFADGLAVVERPDSGRGGAGLFR